MLGAGSVFCCLNVNRLPCRVLYSNSQCDKTAIIRILLPLASAHNWVVFYDISTAISIILLSLGDPNMNDLLSL